MIQLVMCGIVGEIRLDGQPVNEDRLRRMAQAVAHRGPDGEGIWINGSVGLAHRRLAIVDLSEAASQPMANHDGTLVITFNGEIYNYQSLRNELVRSGARFRSASDTEVLLWLYEREGERMLSKLRGMFAFSIWDAARQRLFFARDRLGKKPFFYRLSERSFQFASELKALTAEHRSAIDWQALRTFLGLQYVPSPQTGFLDLLSLPAAHCGVLEGGRVSVRRYDEFPREPKFSGSLTDAARQIRKLVEEAVQLRMIADVPVGAFLSGGMDSSSLVALMARLSSDRIQTFTMGFPSLGFDEREEARAFAQQLGTSHHEFTAQPGDLVELADHLVGVYDAPYADSSCLPTWLLARETRRSVKAVVTGDGGDELFGGYRRYRALMTGLFLKRMKLATIGGRAADLVGTWIRDPRFTRFSRTLKALNFSTGEAYGALFSGSYFSAADEVSLLQSGFRTETDGARADRYIVSRFEERLGAEGALAFDLASYLPDDLNVKMDRATMAHGLEARAPFLDAEVARFAARLPLPFLLKHGNQKPVLAEAMKDILPAAIFRRRKRGFQAPLSEWFRGPLRPSFVDRCAGADSPLAVICRIERIERYLADNDRGADHGNRLWMLFVLATWMQKYA